LNQMSEPKIKICGITNLKDAKASLELGAKFLGFNFYKKSKRFIEPEAAAGIISALPATQAEGLDYFGVFVNHSRKEVEEIAAITGISGVQFHGDEPDDMLKGWNPLRVIRAIRVGCSDDLECLPSLISEVDYLLLDSFTVKSFGGTGKEIQSELLSSKTVQANSEKLFIAGGITPENIKDKLELIRPYAFDLASGVEGSQPEEKDHQKLQLLFKSLKT